MAGYIHLTYTGWDTIFLFELHQVFNSQITWDFLNLILILRLMGRPTLVVTFVLGASTFFVVDTGKQMIAIDPCEDDEEIKHDPNETGKARTFSLVGSPPILVSPSS